MFTEYGKYAQYSTTEYCWLAQIVRRVSVASIVRLKKVLLPPVALREGVKEHFNEEAWEKIKPGSL